MSSAASRSAATPDSIFASLSAELKPAGQIEAMILWNAAEAMYRLGLASAKLIEMLDKDGYTDDYFRLQRAEAKDRAAFMACLNQFHKLESRRVRQHEKNTRRASELLDRAVTRTRQNKPTPPPPDAGQSAPSPNAFEVLFDRFLRRTAPDH